MSLTSNELQRVGGRGKELFGDSDRAWMKHADLFDLSYLPDSDAVAYRHDVVPPIRVEHSFE